MLEQLLDTEIPWNVIFLTIMGCVAFIDVKTMKIPNAIVIPFLITGLLSFTDITDLVFKAGSVLFILIIGYTRIMGMGDLKLWMCMAVFMGLLDSIYAIGIAALLFIIFCLVTDYKSSIKTMWLLKNQILYERKIKKFDQKAYPFGPFMAAGSLAIMVWRFYSA